MNIKLIRWNENLSWRHKMFKHLKNETTQTDINLFYLWVSKSKFLLKFIKIFICLKPSNIQLCTLYQQTSLEKGQSAKF